MFTGIVEETGQIIAITDKNATFECKKVLGNTKIGDSIAVNGVCLTVTSLCANNFTADISSETKNISTFKNIKANEIVNLERAMSINDRFGGHIVSGHIDGIANIEKINKNNDFYDFYLELPPHLSKYIIKKGSITINGISLTIAEVIENKIKIAVIPHTYEKTNLKTLKSGDFVNIEIDMIAKYIEKFLSTSDNKSRIDFDFLQRNGFC